MALRIVFMGSPDFAVPALKALHSSPHEIVAVVSGADKRRGRGNTLSPTLVKDQAQKLGLKVVDWADFKTDAESHQTNWLAEIDLFVVVAFKILPPAILAIPRLGSVNIHASLLPAYRGAAPIHRAVMDGVKSTGCTIIVLDQGVDTGGIIMQERVDVDPDDTTGDVYERLSRLGAAMIVPAVDSLEKGTTQPQKQDHTLATPAPKIHPPDLMIQLDQDSLVVHNMIRGLSPFPTAWMMLHGKRFRIFKTKNTPEISPGMGNFEHHGNRHYLGCATGSVELLDVQLEGKNRMTAEAFFKGRKA